MHGFKNSTNSILFICHNHTEKLLLYPILQRKKEAQKFHFKLSQDHQAVSGNVAIQIQAVQLRPLITIPSLYMMWQKLSFRIRESCLNPDLSLYYVNYLTSWNLCTLTVEGLILSISKKYFEEWDYIRWTLLQPLAYEAHNKLPFPSDLIRLIKK